MKLLFAHGWGFDRHFWDPLIAALSDCGAIPVVDDRGYFGPPHAPRIEGPCIAVTHSFGAMRVLAAPPKGLAAILAINGFDHFAAQGDQPGIAPRVLDRMRRRLSQDPVAVVREFRRSCGSDMPFAEPDAACLEADLLRLRDEVSPPAPVPVTLIEGQSDPLLPPDLRRAVFAGAPRLSHPGGHLLPLEDPVFCARAVRDTLARASGQ